MVLAGLALCVIAFIAVIWWEISKPLKDASAPNMSAASALNGVFESDTDMSAASALDEVFNSEIDDINPATGLMMIGGFDGEGNPYGFDK